jgi:50S ribosomal protein L16 3-hydroxylase
VVRDFLGSYLTEPKAHIYFDPPEQPLSYARFIARITKNGVRLDPKTQLLFAGNLFFINGEECPVERDDREHFRTLADRRSLDDCSQLSADGLELLHAWYCDGFVQAN